MKILCPTDFSEHSLKAMKYAIDLCKHGDHELHILAAYHVPRSSTSFMSIVDEIKEEIEKDIYRLKIKLKEEFDALSTVHFEMRRGYPDEVIPVYAERHEIDLIVMGTQGKNSLRTILFGSVTRKVSQNSYVPVLAIPKDSELASSWGKPVVLAVDQQKVENRDILKLVTRFADFLKTEIQAVHVSETPGPLDLDEILGEKFSSRITLVETIQGSNPTRAIKDYIDSIDAAMLVMIKHDRNFFSRIFRVSRSSDELMMSEIPILVLPE